MLTYKHVEGWSGQFMKKIITFILTGIIVTAVVAAGVYFFLAWQTESGSSGNGPVTATSLIEDIQVESDGELSGFEKQAGSAAQQSVIATQEGASYSVSLIADDAAVYQKDQTPQQTVDASEYRSLRATAETFFQDRGLVKSSKSSDSADIYTSAAVTCQVNVAQSGVPTIGYGCADATAVAAMYNDVEKLIETYESTQGALRDFSAANLTTQKENAITGAILAITPEEPTEEWSGNQFVFGAIDGQWEYVADLSEGASNGKFNVSEGALAAMSDPKWQSVLVSMIQGGERE